MCLFTNTSEICNHPECISFLIPQLNFPTNNSGLITGIITLIQQQTYNLSNLIQKTNLLNQKIEYLSQIAGNKPNIDIPRPEETFSVERIFQWISSDREFSMFIHLKNSLPENVYKEKGFKLETTVVDQNGQSFPLPLGLRFVVTLFTVENPPKKLSKNISGRKILRGTVEVETGDSGDIVFENVVINEVTSHYPNNKFCIVILCPSSGHFKPLVLSGVCVRARKHHG